MTSVVDPELAAVVARARSLAVQSGELLDGSGIGDLAATVPAEARPLLAQWLRDGGYAAALAQIVADDPSLATE